MITAAEQQALTSSLNRVAKVLDDLITQKNTEQQQYNQILKVLELIKGIQDQQQKMIKEIKELKAQMI